MALVIEMGELNGNIHKSSMVLKIRKMEQVQDTIEFNSL